jgi:hypothetical protein
METVEVGNIHAVFAHVAGKSNGVLGNRFEGSRWRLRRMRANGYGNSIFSPICKLLALLYLENERVREPQFDPLRSVETRGLVEKSKDTESK